MILIDIHELDIILTDPVVLRVLKHEVERVRCVIGLQRQYVLVLGTTEDLREGGQVDAEGDVAVAAVRTEALGFEVHGDEGDMGVVHCLQGDAGVVAVEVAVLDEVFDGFYHLGGGC